MKRTVIPAEMSDHRLVDFVDPVRSESGAQYGVYVNAKLLNEGRGDTVMQHDGCHGRWCRCGGGRIAALRGPSENPKLGAGRRKGG